MKVEIVCFTGNSGLTDYSVSLARALKKHVDVTLVTASSIAPRFADMGFAVEKVFRRSRQYPVDIVKFVLRTIKSRPEWVLLQGPLKFPIVDGLVVRFLRLFGIKSLITVHDVLPHYPNAFSPYVYKFYYSSFNKVVVHSEAAHAGVRRLGVNQDILTVPHGVYDIFNLTGIDQTAARAQISPSLQTTDFVVLFFGHLEPRKGLLEFTKAAELLQEYPQIKFLIAGGNALKEHGQQYVEQFEKARTLPNVIVHDSRIDFEKVENYFSASNVIGLPYLEGTTSGVLKLALAFAKPVIATRVGDFPEQIPLGAGIVIEADQEIANSFAQSLLQMHQHEAGYVSAMKSAGGMAQWPDIAQKLHAFLK